MMKCVNISMVTVESRAVDIEKGCTEGGKHEAIKQRAKFLVWGK